MVENNNDDFDVEAEIARYESYEGIDEEEAAEEEAKQLEETLAQTMLVAKKLNVKRLHCIAHLVNICYHASKKLFKFIV